MFVLSLKKKKRAAVLVKYNKSVRGGMGTSGLAAATTMATKLFSYLKTCF